MSFVSIINNLETAGHTAFLVGGAVRDMLLNRKAGDFDITTSATPDEVETLFLKLEFKVLTIGKAFGVVIIIDSLGEEFEVATFRTDGCYGDNRRPNSIEFSSPEEDAKRRDFTINGLFFDGKKIIDFVDGVNDINSKKIRAIGVANDRIKEDSLRMLRAIRFACTLNFSIEEKTFEAIKENASKIKNISMERIFKELNKIMGSDPVKGLNLLKDSGLLKFVLPEIVDFQTLEQNNVHHPEGSVWNHVMIMLSHVKNNANLAWACLLHDIGKKVTNTGDGHFFGHDKLGVDLAEKVLRRIKAPRTLIDFVKFLVDTHMTIRNLQDAKKSTLKKKMIFPFFTDLLILHKLDRLGSDGDLTSFNIISDRVKDIRDNDTVNPKPLITGKDLINLGLKPGKLFGKILGDIFDKQLNNDFNCKKDALDFVKGII